MEENRNYFTGISYRDDHKGNYHGGLIIIKMLTSLSNLRNEKNRNYFQDIMYRLIMKVKVADNLR